MCMRLEMLECLMYWRRVYGAAECVVKDGEVVTPEVSCTLANTMVSVEFDRELATEFDECALTFHSNGGGFITYGMDESRKAYLRPGNIEVGLYVKLRKWGCLSLQMATRL